jgi:transposase
VFTKSDWTGGRVYLAREIHAVRYTLGTRRKPATEDHLFQQERLVGAVGIEPTPGDGIEALRFLLIEGICVRRVRAPFVSREVRVD